MKIYDFLWMVPYVFVGMIGILTLAIAERITGKQYLS
jgi:hypothetical protein